MKEHGGRTVIISRGSGLLWALGALFWRVCGRGYEVVTPYWGLSGGGSVMVLSS